MNLLDRRSLVWSAGLHAFAALALVVAGCVSWFRFHDDSGEILAEFVVEPPGDPEAEEPPPPPPDPEPEAEPDPEPDDVPVPDPPKPEPPKPDPPKKKPIEVSKKIVTFDKPAPPAAAPPKVETRKIGTKGSALTEEEFRKMLDLGAKVSDHTSVPADEAARCAALVRDQLYLAWKRPDSSAVTGTPPTIAIDLSDGGAVLGVELRKSSGNAALDDSALRAARAVGAFRNLTPRFIRANKPLVIQFQLTGGTP